MPSTAKPRLIVDKEGKIGSALLASFVDSVLTVFVSKKEQEYTQDVITIPFLKRIPKIPDNSFSEIFLLYNGEKELLEALPAFVAKAKDSQAVLYFVTNLYHFPAQTFEKLQRHYPEITLIITGEVFSSDIHQGSPLNSLLHEAKEYGRVTLSHSGLTPLYPLALADLVEGIQAIQKNNNATYKTFALFPKYPPTAISVARILQKLYPLLHVDFSKKTLPSQKAQFPKDAVFLLSGNYPLEKRLKELDLSFTPLLPKEKKQKKAKKLKTPRAPFKRWVFFAFSLLFFFLALPSLITLGFAAGGGMMLLQSQKAFEAGSFQDAETKAATGQTLFSVAKQSVSTIKMSFGQVVGNQELLGLEKTMQNGEKVGAILQNGAQAASLLQSVVQGKSAKPKEDFLTGSSKLKESLSLLQSMQVEGQIPERYLKQFQSVEGMVTLVLNTLDTYPQLLGFERRQQYLVLFQNNFELRPSGGFIGSYGLVTFEQGRVASFVIQDVYETDGKLTEHVEPPYALRRHLGATHWYLRDSNYAPDFPTAAAKAAEFLKKEANIQVDGVIALDTTFLSTLLEVTGPVSIPDYKETLTKDNFFLTTQKHVEEKFFPGSTQKRDYLRAVYTALEQRYKAKGVSYQKAFQVIAKGIEEKHVLVAFADSSIQRLFTVNNVSSALWEGRVDDEQTVLDFIGINEANIGLNKNNYYLKRSIEQEVSIVGDGEIQESTTVLYTNTSSAASPFGGVYKAYLRFLFPQGAVVTGLLIDNVETPTTPAITDPTRFTARNFEAPKEVELEQVTSLGKAQYGLLITVPQGQTKTYTLRYTLAEKFPIDEAESHYSIQVFKQPGTLADPYSLTLRYPLSLKLHNASSGVSNVGGKLLYETTLTSDKKESMTFVSTN